MANTTAIAMGTNRKPATPCKENIGTKATQMQSSETKAGWVIWRARAATDWRSSTGSR